MDFPGVDVEAATRAGIKVARIPSANTGNALACAELSIYLILGLLRNQVERVICCWVYLLLFWSFWLIFDTWTDSFCSSKTILGQVLVDGNQLEFQCFIYHTLQIIIGWCLAKFYPARVLHTSEDILQFLCWQKGMASAIAEMRLGEPTGDTLFGKTVCKQLSILLIECVVWFNSSMLLCFLIYCETYYIPESV